MQKVILAALSLVLASPAIAAGDGRQSVELHQAGPYRFTVEIAFDTKDDCNTYGLNAELETQGRVGTLRSFFVDIGIQSTMMGCPPGQEPRHLSLVSPPLEIDAEDGRVDAVLSLPLGVTVRPLL